MGELVPFRPKAKPSRPPESGDGAEILFFTGVQIVRMEDPAPAPKASPKRTPAQSEKPRKRRGRTH